MCVQCESDWAASLSSETPSKPYGMIEGLDARSIVEINARMVSSESIHIDRDTRSPGHSDNGQIFLRAIGNGWDLGNTDHSDNGWVFSGAVGDGDASADHDGQVFSRDDSDKRVAGLFGYGSIAELKCDSETRVESTPGTKHDSDYCSNYKGSASTDSPLDETVCGTLDERLDSFPDFIYALISYVPLTEEEWDELNIETFGIDDNCIAEINDQESFEETLSLDSHDKCLLDSFPINIENDPEIDLLLIQQRIEATIHKRIEENNEKQTRSETISKLLTSALLQKDKNDRRTRQAAQGIEEDPHLWDTESMNDLFTAESNTNSDSSSNVSPRTKKTKNKKSSRFPGPQPKMHIYHGSLFAPSKAHAYEMGLREIRPYKHYTGEWEGFMRAFSPSDANKMGLLDPVHMRGCCDERPANWHLYYGSMNAESEYEAERRHLTDIQRVPGSDTKFYGTIPADDERHAGAMGVEEIRHPWGCCLDGRGELPTPERHANVGVMSAFSVEDVRDRGLLDVQTVKGSCGLFYGYVEAKCELEAWNMGLRKIVHSDFCCAEAEAVVVDAFPDVQYTFYGYMYAHTEQEIVDRGLQNALLVPGYTMKYSGSLQARSEEEAKAMGLFDPSRMKWGDTRLGF